MSQNQCSEKNDKSVKKLTAIKLFDKFFSKGHFTSFCSLIVFINTQKYIFKSGADLLGHRVFFDKMDLTGIKTGAHNSQRKRQKFAWLKC